MRRTSTTPPVSPRSLHQAAGVAPAGFTLMEIIVAVAAVALVAVGLASIFDAVGKTVNGGKRASLFNQYAVLIENQMRRDFNKMTRDGFLTIRQQFIDNNGGAAPDGIFIQDGTDADKVPLSPMGGVARARRADEIVFFARDKFTSARPPMHPDVVVSSDTAMIYYGHGQRRRDDSQLARGASSPPDLLIGLIPQVDDTNADVFNTREARLGIGTSPQNPNLYAADWTLLRKAVLLAKSGGAGAPPIPSQVSFRDPGSNTVRRYDPNRPLDRPKIANTEYQIGLQPAARSVFRAFNRYYPQIRLPAPGAGQNGLPSANFSLREPRRANLASGIVDIASTDLSEIRTVIEQFGPHRNTNGSAVAGWSPNNFWNPNSVNGSNAPYNNLFVRLSPYEWSAPFPDPMPTWDAPPATGQLPAESLDYMHIWMENAFPTESAQGPRWQNAPIRYTAPASAPDPYGVRPRYELGPVGLDLVINNSFQPAHTAEQVAYERADQTAISAGAFLPHCTEFAVDWSFGQTDPLTHELIWHGPATRADTNHNGTIDAADDYVLLPYPFNAIAPTADPFASGVRTLSQGAGVYAVSVPRLPYGNPERIDNSVSPPVVVPSGARPYPYLSDLPHNYLYYDHVISDRLIYGYRAWQPGGQDRPTLVSHFGYDDPTYKRDIYAVRAANARNTPADIRDNGTYVAQDNASAYLVPRADFGRQIDLDNNGYIAADNNGGVTFPNGRLNELIPGEPAPSKLAWAWPKMVRVTITMVDPTEPTTETPFQFIFSLPPDPVPQP